MSSEDFKKEDYLRIFGGIACLAVAFFLVYSNNGSESDKDDKSKTSITKGVETIVKSEYTAGQVITDMVPSGHISEKNSELDLNYKGTQELRDLNSIGDMWDVDLDTKAKPKTEEEKEQIAKELKEDLKKVKVELGLDIRDKQSEESKWLDQYGEDDLPIQGTFDADDENKAKKSDEKGPLSDLVKKEEEKKISPAEVSHKQLILGLIKRLDLEDRFKAVSAGLALRKEVKFGDAELIGEILKRSPPTRVKVHLVEALASLKSPSALPALRFELEQGEEPIIPFVIEALGRIPDDNAVRVLANVVRGSDPRLSKFKKEAIIALAHSNSKLASQALDFKVSKRLPVLPLVLKRAQRHLEGKINYQHIEQDIPSGTILEALYKGSNFMFYYPSQIGSLSKRPWLLVCLHSKNLRYEDLFNDCQKAAKENDMAVLVPYFDPIQFPKFYELDYRSLDGKRSDEFLWSLIDHLGEKTGIQTKKIYFYGENAGGDMLLKLVLKSPERIARAAAVTSNVPFPSKTVLYPFGFGESPFFPEFKLNLEGLYNMDLAVIEMKGDKRVPRFFKSLSDSAYDKGLTLRPELIDLVKKKRVAKRHSWEEAAKYLFKKKS